MVWLCITFAVIIYVMIGGFLSGAFEREFDSCWIFGWPIMLLIIFLMAFAKLPVDFGKKYYNAINKWFEDHI